jgi:hypothetical protein
MIEPRHELWFESTKPMSPNPLGVEDDAMVLGLGDEEPQSINPQDRKDPRFDPNLETWDDSVTGNDLWRVKRDRRHNPAKTCPTKRRNVKSSRDGIGQVVMTITKNSSGQDDRLTRPSSNHMVHWMLNTLLKLKK